MTDSPPSSQELTLEKVWRAAFTVPSFMMAAGAFDNGLRYQLENTDDATLALWVAVGLEVATLSGVAASEPRRAFRGDEAPDISDLLSGSFRTKDYPTLVETAEEIYPDAPYPPGGKEFMSQVRNKMMHTGTTHHAGLVGISLRIVWDTAEWLRHIPLPNDQLRHAPRVMEIERIDQLPDGLQRGAELVAANNVELLESALNKGGYDDTPDLKPIAERELAECREIIGLHGTTGD